MLVGFLTGVGFQVGIAMLGDMPGVVAPSHRTLIQVQEILQGLPGLNLPTLGLSALVAGSIHASQELPEVPYDAHDERLDFVLTERELMSCWVFR